MSMNETVWRLLGIGEEIHLGDEAFTFGGGDDWSKTDCAGQIVCNEHMPHRRRLETGWRLISEERPVAPCVLCDINAAGHGFRWHVADAEPVLDFHPQHHTHWLPLPPLPKRDEAEEA